MKIPYSMLGIPDREVLSKELSEQIDKAVESLPARQKEVFNLTEYEGMNCKQIALVMGCNVNMVCSIRQKARRNLRKKLERYFKSEF